MMKFEPFVGDPLSDTRVSVTEVSGASVVRLEAPQLLELQSQLLSRHLGDLATRAGGRMVVDQSGIEKFSCSWVNELIALTRRCDAIGGRMAIFGFGHDAVRMLNASRLARQLHLARDQDEALDLIGCGAVKPWRLAIARVLAIPVALPRRAEAA